MTTARPSICIYTKALFFFVFIIFSILSITLKLKQNLLSDEVLGLPNLETERKNFIYLF
jgi:hypothetical protein